MPTTNLEISTPYGTATIGPDYCAVKADNHELYSWARRPGHHWPCSDLAELDSITVGFDSGGLVDLEQCPECDPETGEGDITGDELSAWSSDVLRETLPGDHPCWFVTVGQFIGRHEWPESAIKVWG